jgi:hypothetical protein
MSSSKDFISFWLFFGELPPLAIKQVVLSITSFIYANLVMLFEDKPLPGAPDPIKLKSRRGSRLREDFSF